MKDNSYMYCVKGGRGVSDMFLGPAILLIEGFLNTKRTENTDARVNVLIV